MASLNLDSFFLGSENPEQKVDVRFVQQKQDSPVTKGAEIIEENIVLEVHRPAF